MQLLVFKCLQQIDINSAVGPTEIILHCVSVSNQLQQWTNFCMNFNPKSGGVGDASPCRKKWKTPSPGVPAPLHSCYYASRVVHGFILCDPIQPNPSTDWPNPTHCKWKNLDPTQPNTTNSGAYSSVVTYFYTQNLSCTFSQPRINLFMFFADHYTY